jgi:trk/ktr system potassium uptake protein
MIDFRPVIFITGLLLSTLGCAMLLPAIIDLAFGNDDWLAFAGSAVITLFSGMGMSLAARTDDARLTTRSAFLLTTIAWVALAAFAALPFLWTDPGFNYTDAFFESMSGLTTTGATIVLGLDFRPPGLLLWRALLQWLGGIGIIVMAIAVLPMLQVGGMQLFRMESSDTSEKILPRAAQIAGSISLIYVILTAVCAVSYYAAGMSLFDAVTHAMTTIATGGFSTHDASFGFFDNTSIEMLSVLFMILGSLPFVLYLRAVRGNAGALYRDSQVRWFFVTLAIFIVVMGAFAWDNPAIDLERGWRHVIFNVVSIMTGTGYASAGYDNWGPFAVAFFFMIAFVGGCAGSTSCGIKIFRFQVIFTNIAQHANRIIYPNGVFVNRYNGRVLPDHVSAAVLGFMFLFFLVFSLLAAGLSLTGLDTLTSLSSAASAIANVGPGLGELVGPAGNFKTIPDSAKWIMSVGMLLGRLELFTVLVLLNPHFWRS